MERQALLLPFSLRDDQDTPFALYAATVVVKSGSLDPAGLDHIRAEVESRRWLPPAEVYMLRDLAETLAQRARDSASRASMESLRRQASQRVKLTEGVLALRDNLPDLVPLEWGDPSRSRADPLWAAFGPEPWLVTIAAPGRGLPRTLVAVHVQQLFKSTRQDHGNFLSQSFQAKLETGNQGELLGTPFSRLRAQLTPVRDSRPDRRGTLESSLYIFTLILGLSVTLFGAYLV